MDNSWTINYNKNTLKNSFFIEQIKSICLNLTFGKEIINSVQNKIPLQSKNIIFAIEEKEKNLQTSILTLIQTINLFFLENNNEKTIILNENFLIFSKIEYDFCIQLLFQREVKHLFERSIGFFIRFLYFLEYLHSKLCQNILLYETDDDLYYSKKSFISFIDKLSLIFSSKMREISLFTSKISIERKILFRILKFLAYFKTLNHPDNLQQSQTKITNEDLLLYLTNYMKKTLWLKMEENRDELKIDNITNLEFRPSSALPIPPPSKTLLRQQSLYKSNLFDFSTNNEEIPKSDKKLLEKQIPPLEIHHERIISNSGIVRNLSNSDLTLNQYLSMNKIKLKTNLETESIFNSKLINNSANNPKNSLLSNFYLDTKFSVKLKKEEKTNYSSVITEKNTIEKKQDYNEIEKQLTDKIFKNLTMETKNNEKPIEIIVSDERKKFKRNERRELSAMTDDFSQNSNIDENLKYDNSNVDKPPSLFKRKSGKNQSKKLNLSEEDFNKINSKTIIKEKLQYCYFNEKKEQVGIADEELIMSTSKSEMEDKKERNNNEFLMVFDQKKNRKPSNFNSNENKIQFDNDNNSNNIYKEIMKDLERDDFMIGSVMVNSKKKAYKK